MLFPLKNLGINRVHFSVTIRFALLSSIDASDVMLEFESMTLSRWCLILYEALIFCHVVA